MSNNACAQTPVAKGFIILTVKGGDKKIRINYNLIRDYFDINSGMAGTLICMDNEYTYTVIESPEEIDQLIYDNQQI